MFWVALRAVYFKLWIQLLREPRVLAPPLVVPQGPLQARADWRRWPQPSQDCRDQVPPQPPPEPPLYPRPVPRRFGFAC